MITLYTERSTPSSIQLRTSSCHIVVCRSAMIQSYTRRRSLYWRSDETDLLYQDDALQHRNESSRLRVVFFGEGNISRRCKAMRLHAVH